MGNSSTGKRSKVPPHYGRTPHALLDARLGHHANAVFQALAYHDGRGIVNPSLATIGKLADLSVNSVRQALKVLTATGWVEIIELGRKGYRIEVEYRLSYELQRRLPISLGDTGPASNPGVKNSVPVSNPGVKNSPPSVSPSDTKQEVNKNGNKSTPNPLHEGAGDHALSRDPLTIPDILGEGEITSVGYVVTDQGYLLHEDVEDMKWFFADGYSFAGTFAYARDFVPELDFDSDEERAYYSTFTRQEFEDQMFKARLEFDRHARELIQTPQKEQLDAASAARLPKAQQPKQPTTGRGRRLGSNQQDRFGEHRNSR